MAHSPAQLAAIQMIQELFHALIRERAASFRVDLIPVVLPDLKPLLESPGRRIWFAVPGMYGGFHYGLAFQGKRPVLLVDSWCRVVGGSGQRHEITADGVRLVDSGFV